MEITNFQIFKNKQKKEGSKQPDFRITANINGKYEEVGACWWKQDSKGGYYQSCSVKEPKPRQEQPPKEVVSNVDADVEFPPEEVNPNDIPF